MGINIDNQNVFRHLSSYNNIKSNNYNCKVAIWQLPYKSGYGLYDKDNSKWFEAINKNYYNEIENAESQLKMSLNRFKVYTQNIEYSDGTSREISKYPNGNKVDVKYGDNYVFVNITDKNGKMAAEKIYNYDSYDGRKVLYKYVQNGDDTLTIVQVYSYDTSTNKSSDVVNYGYTSLPSTLTKNCKLEKEHYLINGEDAKLIKSDEGEYTLKDKNGKILTFKDY